MNEEKLRNCEVTPRNFFNLDCAAWNRYMCCSYAGGQEELFYKVGIVEKK
jgi:hypothetical protein